MSPIFEWHERAKTKTAAWARSVAILCLAGMLAFPATRVFSEDNIRACPTAGGFGGYISPTLSGITPRITLSRTSGEIPFAVHVSAVGTTATGSQYPYGELEYKWDFGDASGRERFTHPVTGRSVSAENQQRGPEAAYVYSRPGRHTITLTVRGWTGSKFMTRRAAVEVTSLPWTGQDRYFDPDKGNDDSDGLTSRTPWQSWARFSAWLSGGDGRRAFLKRGTTIRATGALMLYGTRIRVAPYGKGSRPVVEADSSFSDASMLTLWANSAPVADHVYEGIEFNGKAAAKPDMLVYAYTGTAKGTFFQDVAFVRCRFTNDHGGGLVVYTGEGSFERMLFWGDEFFHGSGSGAGLGIFPGTAQWLAVVGGSFTGGKGDMFRDHHIYPSGVDHMLFRWVGFGQAESKNFCINTDARKTQGTQYVLIDGVNCTGTMNGIDMSNADNDEDGRFDHVILQSSAIHDTGSIGTQSNALLGYSVRRYTIRDNLFYGNRHREIGISDSGANLMVYRNRFGAPGNVIFAPLPTQAGLFTGNAVVSEAASGQPVASCFSSSLFAIDCNQYRFSTLARPFGNLDDGSAKSFIEWQAAGNDVNGAMEGP